MFVYIVTAGTMSAIREYFLYFLQINLQLHYLFHLLAVQTLHSVLLLFVI